MSTFRIAAGAALLALAGAACARIEVMSEVRLIEQDSGVDVRLRGISAASDRVGWASGAGGTVLRTVDGGRQWQVVGVPGAGELDFRDIQGFDADRAVVLSIGPGEASRVYRTADGGRNWILVLQNRDPEAFLDCMAFEGDHGVILGDPVNGRFQIHESVDGGKHWILRTDGPRAAPGEAAFAASGTCIALRDGRIAVATGGTRARVHYLEEQDAASDPVDAGPWRWQATPAADAPSLPSAGYFSITPTKGGFIVVGGDYQQPDADGLLALLPTVRDAAVPGYQPQPGPAGYRSGIACGMDTGDCIATGPSGTGRWNGGRWTPVSTLGFDAIDLAANVGWVSGDAGRIARIEIASEPPSRHAD